MKNTITRLKAWYLRTFLPFEMEDHPLYAARTEEPTFVDEISDAVDDFFDSEYQIEFTVSSDPNTTHRI